MVSPDEGSKDEGGDRAIIFESRKKKERKTNKHTLYPPAP
jgi:hypothetical protein